MSVQIKAFLYEGRSCRTKEIRRFSIDHDVLSNYDYLRRKVASIFPNIDDGFYMQWKDSDGDLITFNTDDELLQALGQHSENELKLYIKSSSGNCSPPRCGPRFGGQRFSPYQTPMDFVSPEMFCNFPFFASCNKGSKTSDSNDQSSTSKSESSEFKGFDQEYLQHMGNVAAEFLKPFGVDVDILVEKKENKDSEKSPPPQASHTNEKSPPSSTEESPSTSKPSSWTIIDKDEKASDESKSSTDESKPSEQDNMDVDENPRLREAVDRLIGMGFNDNGGWLTNLLKASNCDIGRALDAMQPNRTRKNQN